MNRIHQIYTTFIIVLIMMPILLGSCIPPDSASSLKSVKLWVSYFTNDKQQTEQTSGDPPYLDNTTSKLSGRWISGSPIFYDYYFLYEDLALSQGMAKTIMNVTLHFEEQTDGNVILIYLSLYNGVSWGDEHIFEGGTGGQYKWTVFTVFNELDTFAKVNDCKLKIKTWVQSSNYWYRYRKSYLTVTYIENWIDPSPPIEDYIPLGMGFMGLGILAFLPLFMLMMFRRKRAEHWIPYAFMLFFIGLGCLIGWLWG